MVRQRHQIEGTKTAEDIIITADEVNAIRYAAGYVPKALQKKLLRSAHPLKQQLLLCLYDLINDGEDEADTTCEWMEQIDRGGLTHVNNATYNVFLAMEVELRRQIITAEKPPNFRNVAEILKTK